MENSRRILVADDEAHLLRILTFVLVKQGYDVKAAEEGEAALSLALAFRPEMMILDVMMPKLDGYEVCRRVRQNPTVAGSYVMLLSARGQAADRERGLAAGADEYVTKPFATAELLERVRGVFDSRDGLGRAAA